MKFSINREKMVSIISEYSNILKENIGKPLLVGLYISAKNNKVIFKGINNEIEFIRYNDCSVESEGAVLIKPQLLLEYIKLVENENISFEKKEGCLLVNDAEFSILDEEQYPEVLEISTLTAVKLKGLNFARMLDKVRILNSGSSDLIFNSLKIKFEDNYAEFVSTDSYRLIYLKEEIKTNINRELLLPVESASIVCKILKDVDEEVSISASDDKLIITWQDAYFSCNLLALAFPDYKSLLNNFRSDKKFEFNSTDLNSSLKKVISVTRTSVDTKNVASFNFKGNILSISGMSSNAKINQKVSMIKTGEDLKIGINCKYIKDYVNNVSKNIIIYATNSTSMIKIMEDKNENYLYLVMPVNVRE